jgi:hypothetical protein
MQKSLRHDTGSYLIMVSEAVYSTKVLCLLICPKCMHCTVCTVGYNEFDFFLENEEYRPFDGCKIEI